MSLRQSYRLRLERKRLLLRALRKRRELIPVSDRTAAIRPGDVLLFAVMRNEGVRLPWFIDYYRQLGVDHFLVVDNGSSDGTGAMLAAMPDVSLWRAETSYAGARWGMDWINGLLRRFGTGHWCLTVDADELLVYPHCDSRPLRALTDWLDGQGQRAFGTLLLDLYPRGPLGEARCMPGDDPVEIAPWFDPGNYMVAVNPRYRNLWVQGGVRARVFFAERPEHAPALNKIPLVRWERRYAYVNSTHMLLPRGLNRVYDDRGGERASGVLLHSKFLADLPTHAADELARREHFAGAREYRAYNQRLDACTVLWTPYSERYRNWRQLEHLGLLSSGAWA